MTRRTCNEIDRVIGQEVGQVLTLRIVRHWVRLEIEVYSRRLDRLIEPPHVGMMRGIIPQVPFTEHACRVASLLERVGDRNFIERERCDIIDWF